MSTKKALIGVRGLPRTPILFETRLAVTVIALAWMMSLIVTAHQWAFLINPFESGDGLRTFELLLFGAGWVLMTVGAGAIGLEALFGTGRAMRFLPVVALVHPLSVIAIQSTLRIQTGQWYLSYLTSNIWFVLSDILIPLGLLLIYRSHIRGSLNVVDSQWHVAEMAPESVPYESR